MNCGALNISTVFARRNSVEANIVSQCMVENFAPTNNATLDVDELIQETDSTSKNAEPEKTGDFMDEFPSIEDEVESVYQSPRSLLGRGKKEVLSNADSLDRIEKLNRKKKKKKEFGGDKNDHPTFKPGGDLLWVDISLPPDVRYAGLRKITN